MNFRQFFFFLNRNRSMTKRKINTSDVTSMVRACRTTIPNIVLHRYHRRGHHSKMTVLCCVDVNDDNVGMETARKSTMMVIKKFTMISATERRLMHILFHLWPQRSLFHSSCEALYSCLVSSTQMCLPSHIVSKKKGDGG